MLAACALMFATGIGFATVTAFWPLFIIAVVGTLNPSAGDVSLFLPVEQAALAETVAATRPYGDFLSLQCSGRIDGCVGRACQRTPCDDRRTHALECGRRRAFGLHRLFRHRPDRRDHLLVADTCDRSRADPAGHRAARTIARDRDSPGRALQPRFVRRRTRDSVAARLVAVPPLSAIGSDRRHIFLCHRIARRVLATRLVVVCRADRTHPHDGLYAHPREHIPDARRDDADRPAGTDFPAVARHRCLRWTCPRGSPT